MSLLPDGPIDTLGVMAALNAVPSHIDTALAVPMHVTPASAEGQIDGIVLVASGADALVAAAAVALVAPHAPVPVLAHHGFGLPGFVSDRWRCVFLSTGETAEAHDALARAAIDRAEVIGIGQGPVLDAVAEAGHETFHLPVDVPAPRFGFAGALVATLRLLEAYGALSAPLGDAEVASLAASARDQIALRNGTMDTSGDDQRLARRIGRTLPLIYGTGPLGAVAAVRWKSQVNANAKVAAFANALPGLTHDELSGWGQHGDVTRQVFTLVTLRHGFEHPGETAAMPRVEALVEEVTASRHEVVAAGDGSLAQLLDLAHVGDRVSFHLAQENEIDPGPTSALTA